MNTVLKGLSLGRKGIWALLALCAYFLAATGLVAYERLGLLHAVNEMDFVHRQEERQVGLNFKVNHLINNVNEQYFSPDVAAAAELILVDIKSIHPLLAKHAEAYPVLADDVVSLRANGTALENTPSRTAIADLRSILHLLATDLDLVSANIRGRKQDLLANYRETYNRVTLELLLLVSIAVGLFGGVGLAFFRRLASDIQQIHERAIDIVRGYRGAPLPLTRGDEIGALMEAVNVMQTELRQHETQLEISRQQQFHKEKMAAVGNLAAAVAHEINNPLSAIVGIAESINEEQKMRHCRNEGRVCQPELILDQARRVMSITRQISEFSVPQSMEPELVDLNSLIRSTCSFVSFDRRFRNIRMEQMLDPDLPAVFAVADHLVQVLMNLLINAADAIQDTHPTVGHIKVTTRSAPQTVTLVIEDDGTGIPPEILDKVFIEHFTTKPPGRGSGLGLALCRSLILEVGGNIALESQPARGTRVIVTLPVQKETS